jgi:hypothetical protein
VLAHREKSFADPGKLLIFGACPAKDGSHDT